MRVLFDIVHPAHALFFKRPIEVLKRRKDIVLILSRHKDVTCALLDEFGFPHEPISKAGKGLSGLLSELVLRDYAVIGAARRFRPDVMIGFGGVSISHVGRLLSIPAISFYDSENATLQTRITWPFITHLYVPDSYTGKVPENRTTRLPGIKQLAYLNPSVFRPSREIATKLGLRPDVDNFFVRVVAWNANHDVTKSGWNPGLLRSVLDKLSSLGKVHLSSELPLGDEFDRYLYRGSKAHIHHLIGNCRLLIGESATMAAEAAIMGVPAIYAAHDFPGYVRSLEDAGLVTNIPDPDQNVILGAIDDIMARDPAEIIVNRDSYVAKCPDWSEEAIKAIEYYAQVRKKAWRESP